MWWLALAFAQDVAIEPAGETIVVYDESQILAARDALTERLAALGWHPRGSRADGTVFAPSGAENRWLGILIVGPEGDVRFGMPLLNAIRDFQSLAPANGTREEAVGNWDWSRGMPGRARTPAEASPGGLNLGLRFSIAPEKQAGARADLLGEIQPEILHLRRTVQRVHFHQDVLPEVEVRVDQLWYDGVPWEGGETLPASARCEALVAHAASRADTEEGWFIRDYIAEFLESVATEPGCLAAAIALRLVEAP